MKTTENYLAEISEIRKMMEESSRFLSLSGLSGILVGIYALLGAALTYWILQNQLVPDVSDQLSLLLGIAVFILMISIATVILLTSRRTKSSRKKFWTPGSRLMVLNLSLPLVSGGLLVLIFLYNGTYEIIAPGTLIFYGLALINAAKFTRQEIFYLGVFQLVLGIIAALLPTYSLFIWALGFGVLHIVYGTLMYFRYEHHANKES